MCYNLEAMTQAEIEVRIIEKKFQQIERKSVEQAESKAYKPEDSPFRLGNRSEKNVSRFTSSKSKQESPRAHAVKKLKLRDRIYRDIIEQILLQEEKTGVNRVSDTLMASLDFQAAKTMTDLALEQHVDRHEALDVVSALATVYKNNPDELSKYKLLMDQILNGAWDYQERQEMISETNNFLTDSIQDNTVDSMSAQTVSQSLAEINTAINQEYIVSPDQMVSERGKRELEKIRKEKRNIRLADENPEALKKLREDVEKNTRLHDADRDRLAAALNKKEQARSQQQAGVPKEYLKAYMDIDKELGAKFNAYAKAAREKYENAHPPQEVPAGLKSFLQRFEENVRLSRYIPSGLENELGDKYKPGKEQIFRPNQVNLAELRKDLEQQLAAGVISPELAGELSGLVPLIEHRAMLQPDIEKYRGAERAMAAGLPEEMIPIFKDAVNPKDFLDRLEKMATPEQQAEAIANFKTDVENMAKKLLAVLDSDRKQFAENIFNQLIHEPVYNEIVDGLRTFSNELIQRERDGRLKILIHDANYEYDQQTRQYVKKDINPSLVISKLKDWATRERNMRRYLHNTRVMLETHNFESWQKYAELIEQNDIALFFLENPILERAIQIRKGFIYGKYALNGWKAPEDVFEKQLDTQEIAVDSHVKEDLVQLGIPAEEADRLTSLAWATMGITLEDVDVILNAGPSGKGAKGLIQPYGPISFNPMITIRRFNADQIFAGPNEGMGYTFLMSKVMHGPKGFRLVAQEYYDAESYKKFLDDHERSRIFTYAELEKEGIPFIEAFQDFMSQAGGFGNRWWSWRGEYSYADILEGIKPGCAPALRIQAITKLAEVNIQFANALATRWYFSGAVDKRLNGQLREVIFKRLLQEIAPQAGIYLENNLLHHEKLGKLKMQIAGSRDGQNFSDFKNDKHKLETLMMDAEKISAYLLSGHDGEADGQKLSDLGNDLAIWKKALFGDHPPQGINNAEVITRVINVRNFMQFFSRVVAPDAIKGCTVHIDGKPNKPVKINAFGQTPYIRAFPNYTRMRDIRWNQMGHRVTARMLGDINTLISKGFAPGFEKIRAAVILMQDNPDEMKKANFEPFLKALDEISIALIGVHGGSSSVEMTAQAQLTSYVLGEMWANFFERATIEKHTPLNLLSLPGIHIIARFSSWVHLATNSTKAEIEAQEVRRISDRMVDRTLIGASYGYTTLKNLWMADLLDDRYNTKFFSRGPLNALFKVKVPFSEWVPLIRTGNKTIDKFFGDIGYPRFARKTRWNAGNFNRAHGATGPDVVLDMAEGIWPWVLLLLVSSAITRSQEEEKS